VQQLSDREEIRETIMRWSRAVDTNNWDLFDAAYTDDIEADFTSLGLPAMPIKQLRGLLQKSTDFFDLQHHILSNITYHEVTATTARTSTLVTATSVPKGAPPFQTLAWYHDHLRKTKDGWRISKRLCEKVYDTNPVKEFTPPALSK
jgi:ketosteroid isomerase-like protein